MSTPVAMGEPAAGTQIEKKPVKFSNLLLGAGLNMFEVTTLGQPLEVTKTTMAANRSDTFAGAISRIWGRGGVFGCKSKRPFYLIPRLISSVLLQSTKV
jgi:hypothetical protein